MTMKKKKKTKYQKKTHAVLDVCLVALYLAVDPALQGVDEVVQRVVGGGVERGLVEVVVGGFFFGAGRRGRGRRWRERGGFAVAAATGTAASFPRAAAAAAGAGGRLREVFLSLRGFF